MNKLENWRRQIDALDEKMLNLLARRMNIASKIGKFKKDKQISAFDKERWELILKNSTNKGKALELPVNLVKDVLTIIHKYSIEIQKKVE